MDLERAILQVLDEVTPPNKRIGNLEYDQVVDTERHHYQLRVRGWDHDKRIHGIVVHMDIRDGLVWLEEDNTDYGVAEALVRLGIPKDKIVLGWQSPFMRKHSGFATGEAA
jgi:XisI protein